jgi:hypothetical protein
MDLAGRDEVFGRKEVNYLQFRSDGTWIGQMQGTWRVTDDGKVLVKGQKHVIFKFSEI